MSVSVVIPCYNAERDIGKCLAGVLHQGPVVSDIICVDDGSTDGTVACIRAFAFPDGMALRLIEQPNRGAAAARNAGLRQCTGEFVQFLDADDVLLPGKLEHQACLMALAPDAAILSGSYRVLAADGNAVREVVQEPGDRDPWKDLMQHRLSITSPNLFRRSMVVRAGGWDEQLGSSQEYDLMFRLVRNGGTVVHDPAILTETHQRTTSISHTNPAANWTRYAELRGRIAAHLRSLNDGRDMRPFDQAVFDSIRILYQHDPATARRLHQQLLPTGFRPSVSPATGRAYVMAHRLLGFNAAEQFRRWLGK